MKVPAATTPDETPPKPLGRDDLSSIFFDAETPRDRWRVGAEAEKFGVDATTGAPLQYEGQRGVRRVFEALIESHGWRPERETGDGPVIALKRESASITLEPGAQLELSGAPLDTIHEICAEMRGHLAELREISSEMNIAWLGVGFHPTARQEQLPWVPKRRYSVMKQYLPSRGSGGLDMMRRTATVQANYDYESEADAMAKLGVLLRLSPIVHAMTANAPFVEGRLCGRKSERGDVWLRMDPARSGLIEALWTKRAPRYEDYVEWALDAGMFLFRRGDEFIENTGQTFRSFLEHGFKGHRPVMSDWIAHVNSLFPEARLKRTLEVRACDSLPQNLACSVPALFTGIVYDARALDEAQALTEGWSYAAVSAARPGLVRDGLRAVFLGQPAQQTAERVLEIALGGLERRARLTPQGADERIHLKRLGELVAGGQSPADLLTDGLHDDDPDLSREILARTRV